MKGSAPRRLERLDHRLRGLRDVRHPAAPAPDRDALPGLDEAGDLGLLHLGANGGAHVVDAGRVEGLAHPRHARERHVEPSGNGNFEAVAHVGVPREFGKEPTVAARGRGARPGESPRASRRPGPPPAALSFRNNVLAERSERAVTPGHGSIRRRFPVPSRHRRPPGPLPPIRAGAMPFFRSSSTAWSVLRRCSRPIPRSTWSAFVNWMLV